MSIFQTDISVSTDEPERISALAEELNRELYKLRELYPTQKQAVILTLALLNYLEQNQKLKDEINMLTKDKEKLNQSLQSFLININVE